MNLDAEIKELQENIDEVLACLSRERDYEVTEEEIYESEGLDCLVSYDLGQRDALRKIKEELEK